MAEDEPPTWTLQVVERTSEDTAQWSRDDVLHMVTIESSMPMVQLFAVLSSKVGVEAAKCALHTSSGERILSALDASKDNMTATVQSTGLFALAGSSLTNARLQLVVA